MFERVSDGLFALDDGWCFTYVNHAAERILARPRAELLGHRIWDVYPDSLGTRFELEYRRALEQQTQCAFTEFFQGLHTWMEVRVFPSSAGLTICLRDVTDEVDAEARVARSELRYRSLVDASAAIVWSTPASGNFEEPQPAWSAFTGQNWDQLKGTGWLNAVHPDDRVATLQAWHSALQNRTIYQTEHRLCRKDGEYRDMLVRAAPILDREERVIEWVGTHTDITEHRRTAAQRDLALAEAEAARAEAEDANRTKSVFLARMSHDLRTPLNAIGGYADLVEIGIHGPVTNAQVEAMQRIKRAKDHLLTLINDILSFAKLEAGQVQLEIQDLPVHGSLRGLEELIENQVEEKGLRYEYEAGPPEVQVAPTPNASRRSCSTCLPTP